MSGVHLLQAGQAHEGARREEEARKVEEGRRDFCRRKKNEPLEQTLFFVDTEKKKNDSIGKEKKL